MTLKQAVLIRNDYEFLIGTARNGKPPVYDVIVVPDDNYGNFIEDYKIYMDEVSNDELLLNHLSRSYSVQVVYEVDPEFVDILVDDISVYENDDDNEIIYEVSNASSADIVWDAITESAKRKFDYSLPFGVPTERNDNH